MRSCKGVHLVALAMLSNTCALASNPAFLRFASSYGGFRGQTVSHGNSD